MNSTMKTLIAFAGVLSVAGLAEAAEIAPTTLKPIAGEGAAPGQSHLLNVEVGSKRAVAYFLNESGQCKLTILVAQAFNGEDVPDPSTVRFEVALDPARSALFDTAEGKALEFTCQTKAEAMNIRSLDQVADYSQRM
jgi:hypothetical protein